MPEEQPSCLTLSCVFWYPPRVIPLLRSLLRSEPQDILSIWLAVCLQGGIAGNIYPFQRRPPQVGRGGYLGAQLTWRSDRRAGNLPRYLAPRYVVISSTSESPTPCLPLLLPHCFLCFVSRWSSCAMSVPGASTAPSYCKGTSKMNE